MVSVVIPTYNRARFVVQAVESALNQSWRDREVVVVDDGSTDGTGEALARFEGRIRYLHQPNRGEAAARNRGVAEAQGTWVAFLDSDDLWEERALEVLLDTSSRLPQAGLVAMRARSILEDGTPTGRVLGKRSAGPLFTTRSLLWGDAGGVLMPMVRRELLLQAGGFDESLASATDCDMWLRLSFQTVMVGVREPLMRCRSHPGNLSADGSLNARMWLRILEKLARDHPDFVRDHPWTYRRALGKERMRLGRELLAWRSGDAPSLLEARRMLAASVRAFPFSRRAWTYLAWSRIAPRHYGRVRRLERGLRKS